MMPLKNKAIIVASETTINFHPYFQKKYFIVGVERGALVLMHQKIPIDLAIGDFDKVTKEELKEIKRYALETKLVSRQKDYLDGELAILEIQKREIENIRFVAEPTKRYDKNISICDLVWKYNIVFFNETSVIFRINPGTTKFNYEQYKNKKYISFLANQPSIITINNFKYNVKNLLLLPFDNRAISNEFIDQLNGEVITDKPLITILSI